MKKRSLATLALAALLLSPYSAVANEDERQEKQAERIQQGEESGALNKREAARLKRGQRRISKAEEKAEADGNVTEKESKHLNRMQNRASARIHKQKHDGQKSRRR
jgi:hypothetical protein